jgi:hypothetical protein
MLRLIVDNSKREVKKQTIHVVFYTQNFWRKLPKIHNWKGLENRLEQFITNVYPDADPVTLEVVTEPFERDNIRPFFAAFVNGKEPGCSYIYDAITDALEVWYKWLEPDEDYEEYDDYS